MLGLKFKIVGIPVLVTPGFFILSLLLGYSRMSDIVALLSWVGVVFVSILVHELGHALVYKRFGHRTEIVLYQMGGLTYGESRRPLSPGKKMLVSFCGPLAGFLLGGLAVGVGAMASVQNEFAELIIKDLLWVNLLWGILNLVPMLPLDGGHVLENLVALKMPGISKLVALVISVLTALTGLALALKLESIWIGFLIVYFGFSNAKELVSLLTEEKGDAQVPANSEVSNILSLIQDGQYDRAIERAARLAGEATSAKQASEFVNLKASAQYKKGAFEEAVKTLESLPADHFPDYLLFGQILAERGDIPRATEVLLGGLKSENNVGIADALAVIYIATGDIQGLSSLISQIQYTDLSGGNLSRIALLFHKKEQYADSFTAWRLLFEKENAPQAAYNVACAAARLSDLTLALEWLQIAAKEGFLDMQQAKTDPDLAALATHPQFIKLMDSAQNK